MVGIKDSESISYADAKELARSKDVSVRAALAEREDLAGELLYFLAEDDDPEVRRAVAANAAAPRQTDLLLARDQNEIVRGGLAGKIANLAPGLSSEESNKIRAQTFEALETLARDQITQVRALLSEALKDVVDAQVTLSSCSRMTSKSLFPVQSWNSRRFFLMQIWSRSLKKVQHVVVLPRLRDVRRFPKTSQMLLSTLTTSKV